MSYYDDLRAGDEEMIREWGRPVKLRGKTDPIIAIFNEPYGWSFPMRRKWKYWMTVCHFLICW